MAQLTTTAVLNEQSRNENEDILLFAKYIRHGLSHGTDLQTLWDYCLWYWRNQIRPTFFSEEQVVLPYVGKHFFASQLMKEHDDIRDLVLILDKNPESSLFSILATFVEFHVQFKKSHFSKFLESISYDQAIGEHEKGMQNTPVSADEWKSAFWKKK